MQIEGNLDTRILLLLAASNVDHRRNRQGMPKYRMFHRHIRLLLHWVGGRWPRNMFVRPTTPNVTGEGGRGGTIQARFQVALLTDMISKSRGLMWMA